MSSIPHKKSEAGIAEHTWSSRIGELFLCRGFQAFLWLLGGWLWLSSVSSLWVDRP